MLSPLAGTRSRLHAARVGVGNLGVWDPSRPVHQLEDVPDPAAAFAQMRNVYRRMLVSMHEIAYTINIHVIYFRINQEVNKIIFVDTEFKLRTWLNSSNQFQSFRLFLCIWRYIWTTNDISANSVSYLAQKINHLQKRKTRLLIETISTISDQKNILLSLCRVSTLTSRITDKYILFLHTSTLKHSIQTFFIFPSFPLFKKLRSAIENWPISCIRSIHELKNITPDTGACSDVTSPMTLLLHWEQSSSLYEYIPQYHAFALPMNSKDIMPHTDACSDITPSMTLLRHWEFTTVSSWV